MAREAYLFPLWQPQGRHPPSRPRPPRAGAARLAQLYPTRKLAQLGPVCHPLDRRAGRKRTIKARPVELAAASAVFSGIPSGGHSRARAPLGAARHGRSADDRTPRDIASALSGEGGSGVSTICGQSSPRGRSHGRTPLLEPGARPVGARVTDDIARPFTGPHCIAIMTTLELLRTHPIFCRWHRPIRCTDRIIGSRWATALSKSPIRSSGFGLSVRKRYYN